MEFYQRPETTDQKVIDEVVKRNVYEHKKTGFLLKNSPVWLDLGGNIGTFACKASEAGCKVISYEPEPENYDFLCRNIERNKSNAIPIKAGVVAGEAGTLDLYVCGGVYNKYRHTIFKKRGRKSITIDVHNFREVLEKYKPNGIKLDIEGAEIDILDSMKPDDWPDCVNQVTFEYSFDIDPSIARFKRIVDNLGAHFDIVHHRKMDWTKEKYEYWPAAVMVYAKKNE